jgi:acyl-CoA oxidase
VATHTVALCQLRVEDQDCGLHWFIIPLRDRETGRLLPGISAGSLGAKMVRNQQMILFEFDRMP